jgi:hypothetical protein
VGLRREQPKRSGVGDHLVGDVPIGQGCSGPRLEKQSEENRVLVVSS